MLRKSYLYLIVFFLSCDKAPDLAGILGPDEVPEITAGSLNTFIDGSSVIISWLGNESARIFDYRLVYEDVPAGFVDPHIWASDSNSTQASSLTMYNLDDGTYTFYLTPRYDTDHIGSEQFLPFEIDAIQGPALRIYPLSQSANTGDEIDVYLYFDVPNTSSVRYFHVDIETTLGELIFIPELYQQGALLTQYAENGATLVSPGPQYSLDNSVMSIDGGVVPIDGSGFWGTGPIAKFSLLVDTNNISNDDKMCEIRIKSDDVSIFDNQEPPQQIHFPYYMSGVVAVKKTIQ